MHHRASIHHIPVGLISLSRFTDQYLVTLLIYEYLFTNFLNFFCISRIYLHLACLETSSRIWKLLRQKLSSSSTLRRFGWTIIRFYKTREFAYLLKIVGIVSSLLWLVVSHKKKLSYFVSSDDHMADTICQGCPGLEIYNSHFTSNFGEWALGFCGGIYCKENPGFPHQTDYPLRSVTFLDLSNRCIHNLINKVKSIQLLSLLVTHVFSFYLSLLDYFFFSTYNPLFE